MSLAEAENTCRTAGCDNTPEPTRLWCAECIGESANIKKTVSWIRKRQKTDEADYAWVYFIREPSMGAIKIGIAKDVRHRFGGIQTSNPHELELLGYFWTAPSTERELHLEFDKHRIRGEWFRDCPEIRQEIERRCTKLKKGEETMQPKPRAKSA